MMHTRKGDAIFRWTPAIIADLCDLRTRHTWAETIALFNQRYDATFGQSALQKYVPVTPYEDVWAKRPAALELLHTFLGKYPPHKIARYINTRLGTKFTGGQVAWKIRKDRLNPLEAQGDPNITMVARELGISPNSIRVQLAKLNMPAYGEGAFAFVTQEALAILKTIYPQHTSAWVGCAEAAKKLDRPRAYVLTALQKGQMKGWKFGHNWRIDARSLDEFGYADRKKRRQEQEAARLDRPIPAHIQAVRMMALSIAASGS